MRVPAGGAGTALGSRKVIPWTASKPDTTRPKAVNPCGSNPPCGVSVMKNCEDDAPCPPRAIAITPSPSRLSTSALAPTASSGSV